MGVLFNQMVEYSTNLDLVFGSLSDPIRRDILSRLTQSELSVSQIAAPYRRTFAAIAKHLVVLERAGLVRKRRQGNAQIVQLAPDTLISVDEYLRQYRRLMDHRFDALETLLEETQRNAN